MRSSISTGQQEKESTVSYETHPSNYALVAHTFLSTPCQKWTHSPRTVAVLEKNTELSNKNP